MANKAAVLIMGILIIGGGLTPVHESLSLEAVVSKERGETVVIARLRNRGATPCLVVVDDYLCQIETQLYDESGALLPVHDMRSVLGMRIAPEELKTATLNPGDTVDLMFFHRVPDDATASARYLHWELQEVAGQTLKVGFTYSLPEAWRARAVEFGAGAAAFGDWASPKIDIPTLPLTQALVNNILSRKRLLKDARTIPMLIQALADGGNEVRVHAAASLAGLKAKAAAASLAERLRKDPDRSVRLSAAWALGEIADPETRPALEAASREDGDDLVRTRCKDALEKLRR